MKPTEAVSSLKTRMANLGRVYRARNETDLETVMSVLVQLLDYAQSLEQRIAKLENHSGRGYVKDRTAYLGLK